MIDNDKFALLEMDILILGFMFNSLDQKVYKGKIILEIVAPIIGSEFLLLKTAQKKLNKGNDTITGGAGGDNFTFNNRNEGIDTITDFLSSQGDKIAVSAAGFGGGLAAETAITAEQFVADAQKMFKLWIEKSC